jgi:hypothetical protein
MKKEGRQFVHSGGDVNEWCGICHGWAVAAYWEQRPVKPVWVKGVDGTLIQFLPDDIKGLISQYWGFVKYDNHMLGYRCNYFDISVLPSDPGTGLTLDYPCFGMNPATFHLAVTNYMGLQGRNFVFEPMVDAEVWNHPVWKYKTVYYNPITLAEGSVNNSIVTIDDARRNLTYFLSFLLKNKSSDSVYLIGVKTTMYYIGEIKPDHKNKYIPDDEKNKTFSYVLELDGDRNILQGEWISNDHPNWILTPKVDASTPEDDQIPMWLGSPDYLASIKEYIIRQSNNKIPLKAIIRYLIQNSAN